MSSNEGKRRSAGRRALCVSSSRCSWAAESRTTCGRASRLPSSGLRISVRILRTAASKSRRQPPPRLASFRRSSADACSAHPEFRLSVRRCGLQLRLQLGKVRFGGELADLAQAWASASAVSAACLCGNPAASSLRVSKVITMNTMHPNIQVPAFVHSTDRRLFVRFVPNHRVVFGTGNVAMGHIYFFPHEILKEPRPVSNSVRIIWRLHQSVKF